MLKHFMKKIKNNTFL